MFNEGPKACKRSANCDLYKELFQKTYDKAIRLQVRWMPSHLDCTESGDRPSGVSLLDAQGNAHADALAEVAAKKLVSPYMYPHNICTGLI